MYVAARLRHVANLGVGLLLALALSCHAPHDNPFDPALGGNVAGRVLTRRATPIAGARVQVAAAGREDVTDSAGSFYIYDLPEESVWVVTRADSFAPDSAWVGLAAGQVDSLTRYLDGLPYIRSCEVTSHVYGRSWPPDPLAFCRLAAEAGDVDGEADVESVWVEIPDLAIARRLAYDPDRRSFRMTIWADSLPGLSLETLVGLKTDLRVADKEGAVSRGPDCTLGRIIMDLPVIVYPAGGLDTVATDTTFRWHQFSHGFGVSYHCEVTRIEGGGPGGVAATFDTPRTGDTSYRFNRALLAPGDYYWTVEAIDAQGNSSRSLEELFRVR
jgi:hypothetical protein